MSAGGHTALIPLLSSSAPQVSSLAVSALAGLAATNECATALAESGSIPKVATIMSSTQVCKEPPPSPQKKGKKKNTNNISSRTRSSKSIAQPSSIKSRTTQSSAHPSPPPPSSTSSSTRSLPPVRPSRPSPRTRSRWFPTKTTPRRTFSRLED